VDELVELLLAATRHEPLLPAEERRELEDSWHRAQARRADLADRLGRLTPREREILHLLYAGASVARIAETSKVTRATVRSQVKAVLRKLDVKTQLAAVAALDDALDGRDGGVPAPPRVAEAPATC
jgi:DNA-binding NarL/FixJ family response regulator